MYRLIYNELVMAMFIFLDIRSNVTIFFDGQESVMESTDWQFRIHWGESSGLVGCGRRLHKQPARVACSLKQSKLTHEAFCLDLPELRVAPRCERGTTTPCSTTPPPPGKL